ncbi:MAG TPA: hypothetical protein VGG44_10600 [Tepidisphaeraceae bacterium]|jgi:hypothetical protein
MRVTQTAKSVVSVICLAFIALEVCGCLTADKSVSAVYDAKHDRFRFLIVFQNIASQRDKAAGDLTWLKGMYANRDHLIVSPMGSPSPMEGLGEGAYLRLSDSMFSGLDLSNPGEGKFTSQTSVVPLNDIEIIPGRFFVRRQRSLCYYQQIVVPGKTADGLLDYANGQLAATSANSVVAGIDAEIQHRQSGTAQASWDEFSKSMIDQTTWMMKHDSKEAGAPSDATGDPLDTQSLQMIRAGLVGGTVKIVRSGATLHASAEMTAADVAGVVAFVDAFRKAVSDFADHPNKESRRNKAWSAMMDSGSLVATDATHVEASVDLIKLFGAFYNPLESPPSGSEPRGKEVVNLLNVTGDSLEVDNQLTVGKIVADFMADSLAANPPVKSVEPGAGMGTIQPATTEPAGASTPGTVSGSIEAR